MKFKLITAIDRVNYFSDLFIGYYKKIFDIEEFYFMVHHVNSIEVKNYLLSHGFNHDQMFDYRTDAFGWGNNLMNQNMLVDRFIQAGYTVIYADIDELIFHPNLKQYIACKPDKLIAASGVVIFQHPSEQPLDITRPIFEQRDYCRFDRRYFSKVCILKIPFKWHAGRHNRPNDSVIDKNIYLIDVGKVCNNLILENNNVNKSIYRHVYSRYKESSIDKIHVEWKNLIRNEFTNIPDYLKKSCPL
jgi:hypothetical protein